MEIDIGLFWRGRLSPRTYQLTITDVPVRTCAEMLTGGELELLSSRHMRDLHTWNLYLLRRDCCADV